MASSTSRRRVLITGVCGLVGRVFFDYLTKTHPTKYEVFGIDLHLNVSSRYRSQNNNDSLKSQWSPPEHRFFQCDVTDRIKFHRIIEEQQIEMIVHLAAVLEDDPDVDKITRVNIEGTRNAFEAPGVRRIVFASSGMIIAGYLTMEPYRSIYDDTFDDSTMLTSLRKLNVFNDPPKPDVQTPGNEAYSHSKILGEKMAASYVNGTAKSIICARFGSINIKDEPEATWFRSCWCSHRDACVFLEKALTAPMEISGTYFVVSNNHRVWVDMDNAKNDLGFVPQDGAEKL